MSQTPSVGRIVHYVSHGTPVLEDGTQRFPSVCRAAVITEVTTGPRSEDGVIVTGTTVGLCVLNPTGQFFHALSDGGCAWDRTGQAGGTWHWPEYVPGQDAFAGSNQVTPPSGRGIRIPEPVRSPEQEPLA